MHLGSACAVAQQRSRKKNRHAPVVQHQYTRASKDVAHTNPPQPTDKVVYLMHQCVIGALERRANVVCKRVSCVSNTHKSLRLGACVRASNDSRRGERARRARRRVWKSSEGRCACAEASAEAVRQDTGRHSCENDNRLDTRLRHDSRLRLRHAPCTGATPTRHSTASTLATILNILSTSSL